MTHPPAPNSRAGLVVGPGTPGYDVEDEHARRNGLRRCLGLDRPARAELAAQLVASLDGGVDADAEAEWSAEIERRIAGIAGGTIASEPWHSVRRRIEERIRNQ